MYKRKPRVLFISDPGNCAALLAERYALADAGGVFEARGRYLRDACQNATVLRMLAEDDLVPNIKGTVPLSEADCGWPDLVVLIGDIKPEELPSFPVTAQLKVWPIATKALPGTEELYENTDFLSLKEDLRRRIRSIVGGLSLMSN